MAPPVPIIRWCEACRRDIHAQPREYIVPSIPNERFWIVESEADGRPAFRGVRENEFVTEPCPSEEAARTMLKTAVVLQDSPHGPGVAFLVDNAPLLRGPRSPRRGAGRVVGGQSPYTIVQYGEESDRIFIVFGPGGTIILPVCPSLEQADIVVDEEIERNPPVTSSLSGLK